jgi:hypothetical protein
MHSSSTGAPCMGPPYLAIGRLNAAVMLNLKHLRLFMQPAEGPLSKESPASAADLRLLCSGQFLDNAKTLKGVDELLQQQSCVPLHSIYGYTDCRRPGAAHMSHAVTGCCWLLSWLAVSSIKMAWHGDLKPVHVMCCRLSQADGQPRGSGCRHHACAGAAPSAGQSSR